MHCNVRFNVLDMGGLAINQLICILNRSSELTLNLFVTHKRLKLEYGSCLWKAGYVGDVKLLERVQRGWAKAVAGMGVLSYVKRLKKSKLFSFKDRPLRADMILSWTIFN